MSTWERALVWLAALAVGATGVVYGVMRYAVSPADEWAVVNHPWQPNLQHAHVVAAPLLVFAGGLLLRDHVLRGLAEGGSRGRASGLGMVLSFVPMVLSGALIQVAVSEGWRRAWITVHVAASALWLLGFVVHPVLGRRREGADAPPASPPDAAPGR